MEGSINKTVIARLLINSRLLFLLGLANGAPLLAKKLLGARFSIPVDSGTTAPDHQAFFGSSKTVRGILLSVFFTALGGCFLGLPFGKAALIGTGAMAGDLFSSFCKRRLRLPASSKAIGLDQVPESLFPILLCRKWFSLKVLDVLAIVVSFFLSELVVSKVLYRFDLRDQPY
ncbi:MAG: CDP-archaeol synthase [Verrucomicrobia bacterium]|nr:CDP-archaeol synthase [Verrucomicrobiota bacterium]MBV8485749.1 CDP-archaeol synthase [Verrucomicrobiota bacterium]